MPFFLKGTRERTGIKLGYLSILINLCLFVLKLILGLLSNSLAIISDAFHTLSDILTSALVVFSFKVSSKPSDAEHPFGYGRVEQISAIIMAILLGVAGLELIKSGIDRLLHPVQVQGSFLIAGVIFLTVLVKEWQARFTEKFSSRYDSSVLEADAWHHRSDAVSSSLVVIAIIMARYGIIWFDGITGIFIGLYICYIAYRISRKPADQILGGRVPEKLIKEIDRIIKEIPEILDHHDIIFHDYGSSKIVTLHIEVDESMSLSNAHTLAEVVMSRIKEDLGIYATVHVDPATKETKRHLEVRKAIGACCKNQKFCDSYHSLRLSVEKDKLNILFHVKTKEIISKEDEDKIKSDLTGRLKEEFPQVNHIIISIEPYFTLEK